MPLPMPAVIVLSVPATVIILLTVFGNLLVLFFKARVGRTNTTLLVWNLGLTDFLVGLFVLPIGAVYLIQRKWIFGRLMCRIWVNFGEFLMEFLTIQGWCRCHVLHVFSGRIHV